MTLTLEKKTKKFLYFLIFICGVFSLLQPISTNAQESLTLSVSPTLFDMTAHKEQEWQSSIKVINVNNYDLTVYADVVNFVPRGESGEVSFVPISKNDADGATLAQWFTISHEPIVIPREQTVEIPFTIKVPADASPGGHYAAILIGTKSIKDGKSETKVQTSQMVTSLVFTKIAGDINESGTIREFRTTENFLSKPEATFELRFENKGNVYLQPQGEIKITNMWGEERGIIPINQNSQYGKVPHKTPGSDGIRKFTFEWKGEWSVTDVGRYTAIVTLGYGTENRQFTTSKTNFWVIPIKPLLGILAGIIIFFTVTSWLVRRYINRMLISAGLDVDDYRMMKKSGQMMNSRYTNNRHIKIHAPVKEGILDLKHQLQVSDGFTDRLKTFWNFCYKNYIFFSGLIFILLCISVAVWYVKNANTEQRAYEVIYVNSDSNVKVSSEEIIYNELKSATSSDTVNTNTQINTDKNLPKIILINRSGVPGVAAEIKMSLEKMGYLITELEADLTQSQLKTVIVYSESNQDAALKLSTQLNNALISLYDTENDKKDTITIFIGSDMSH